MTPGLALSCEHARNAVPAGEWLGVSQEALDGHASWDPWALDAARAVAAATGAPLVEGHCTRMFVDLNRSPENPSVIPEVSFGVPVPGNQGLSAAAREARLARHHAPFRAALLGHVEAAVAARGAVLHLSMHSFTDVIDGVVRPYHLGVLFHTARAGEDRWASRILDAWRAAGFDARANLPYPGHGDGSTTWLRGLYPDEVYAGLEIELSHALDAPGRALAVRVLIGVLAEAGLAGEPAGEKGDSAVEWTTSPSSRADAPGSSPRS